jgi:O-acetyl-ADP-ribose deacetylase (regulator of RNase III)
MSNELKTLSSTYHSSLITYYSSLFVFMVEGLLESFVGGRVFVGVGDLTRQKVDAVVNAANSSLLGGGGVDGAIHSAGGARILEECREIRRTQFPGGLPAGQAVATTAGNLPARYVIHTVGPVYGQHEGREALILADCYRNSLALAVKLDLRSIAFPAISTGIYAYPRAEAAAVASRAIEEFLKNDERLAQVHLIFFGPEAATVFLENHSFTNSQ